MHKVLGETVCSSGTTFSLKISGIHKRSYEALLDSQILVYLLVTANQITISNDIISKLKCFEWSIVDPIDETSSTIYIACWTPNSKADQEKFEYKFEIKDMDTALEQVVQHYSTIGCSFIKSYNINYIHLAVVTMSSL